MKLVDQQPAGTPTPDHRPRWPIVLISAGALLIFAAVVTLLLAWANRVAG